MIQIRAEDIRSASAEHAVLFALEAAAEDLSTGALVTIGRDLLDGRCRLPVSSGRGNHRRDAPPGCTETPEKAQ